MILAGKDPDTITPEAWCDVAWAYLLRSTPSLSNPHEYRDALWTVLYEGKLTAEMEAKQAEEYTPGGETPLSAFEEMEAMKAAAIAAREATES